MRGKEAQAPVNNTLILVWVRHDECFSLYHGFFCSRLLLWKLCDFWLFPLVFLSSPVTPLNKNSNLTAGRIKETRSIMKSLFCHWRKLIPGTPTCRVVPSALPGGAILAWLFKARTIHSVVLRANRTNLASLDTHLGAAVVIFKLDHCHSEFLKIPKVNLFFITMH